MGIAGISKSQVSGLAKSLGRDGDRLPQPALDAGPYTYVWVDALSQKVQEGRRIVNVAVVVATGVNADGHREILGVDLITTEDGPAGLPSSGGWWPEGCRAFRWSSPTPTRAWSMPSPRCCPELPGSDAESASSATSTPGCPRRAQGMVAT